MTERTYIKDAFGNNIPLLDDYGNLSMEVIMLYTEDKLTAVDRKAVNDIAANDEMAKDALDGFALAGNASKTRTTLGNLNREIQKQSGANPLVVKTYGESSNFEFRKIAAAIGFLIVVGTGSYFVATHFFGNNELAENNSEIETTVQETEVAAEAAEDKAAGISESENDVLLPVEETISLSDETNVAQQASAEKEKAELKANQKQVAAAEPAKANLAADSRKTPETNLDGAASSASNKDKSLELAKKAASTESEIAMDSDKKDVGLVAKDREINSRTKAAESKPVGGMMAASSDDFQAEDSERAYAAPESLSNREQQNESAAELKGTKSGENGVAKFPGGDIAMYKFIDQKKNYTPAMEAQNMKGSVTVTFDIEPDGRVSNPKIKKGITGVLDEDALRVIRSMPNWEAATKGGNKVRSSRTVLVKYGN